jgi:regulator of replication initiation timing
VFDRVAVYEQIDVKGWEPVSKWFKENADEMSDAAHRKQLEAEVERLRDKLAAITGEAAWPVEQELLQELLAEIRRVEGELTAQLGVARPAGGRSSMTEELRDAWESLKALSMSAKQIKKLKAERDEALRERDLLISENARLAKKLAEKGKQ